MTHSVHNLCSERRPAAGRGSGRRRAEPAILGSRVTSADARGAMAPTATAAKPDHRSPRASRFARTPTSPRSSETGCRPPECRRCPTSRLKKPARSSGISERCVRETVSRPERVDLTLTGGHRLRRAGDEPHRCLTCRCSATIAAFICCVATAIAIARSPRRLTGRPTTAATPEAGTARCRRSTPTTSRVWRRSGRSRCRIPHACRARRSSSTA